MTTMESDGSALRVDFPDFSGSLLQKLNLQRQRGQLCDVTVLIQGQQYRAHRAVLAASSPYFCDQVLLKNSARVVLPDVMRPCVFERLLLSCYTGTLLLPAGELVAFLTAASFLQMWHVVDKCTELLEVGGGHGGGALSHRSGAWQQGVAAALCGGAAGDRGGPSPGNGSYRSPGEESALGLEQNGGGGGGGGGATVDSFAKMEMEHLLEGGFSPPALDPGAVRPGGGGGGGYCSPPAEPECSGSEVASQNGEDEEGGGEAGGGFQYARRAYIPPSIMGHRKWVHVKSERSGRGGDDCAGLFCGDPEQLHLSRPHAAAAAAGRSPLDNGIDEKLVAHLEEEGLDGERPYDDPLDFYGTTMEGFSADKDIPPDLKADMLDGVAAAAAAAAGASGEDGGGGGGGAADPVGPQEDATSRSSFASAAVYKLYPCQCGKSFTHKSQRDRHMSMHLGLRPYGCAVCGKSFKMKHHLVGHMKIHTGVKPYECSLCAKRFMWRDSFNRHTSSCARSHQARGGGVGGGVGGGAAAAQIC